MAKGIESFGQISSPAEEGEGVLENEGAVEQLNSREGNVSLFDTTSREDDDLLSVEEENEEGDLLSVDDENLTTPTEKNIEYIDMKLQDMLDKICNSKGYKEVDLGSHTGFFTVFGVADYREGQKRLIFKLVTDSKNIAEDLGKRLKEGYQLVKLTEGGYGVITPGDIDNIQILKIFVTECVDLWTNRFMANGNLGLAFL